ncbi:MAG: ABC transporter ATP-binding protein, partial [Nocardioidaceae bacterium]
MRRPAGAPAGGHVEATGAEVTLHGVGKRHGEVVAVDDLSLHVPAGSITALLGPSGCGKSTTLEVVAGLVAADTGDVRLDGVSVLAEPAERRPVSLVFQKPTLFPHLDVDANVGFGLRMAGVAGERRRRTVAEMLDRVRLGGLGSRRVAELSGGQEQRVALARALVTRPRLLLLDEPFSQLDAELRADMRALVRELHEATGVTTLFVTHDQAEAVEVADRIAVMAAGRLLGEGPPELFYTQPPDPAAARFFGFVNEVAGVVAGGRFQADGATLSLATARPDGRAVLMARPDVLWLGPPGDGPGDGRHDAAGTVEATVV